MWQFCFGKNQSNLDEGPWGWPALKSNRMIFEQSNEQPSKSNILTDIMWKNYKLTHIFEGIK